MSDSSEEQKRILWLTPEQRAALDMHIASMLQKFDQGDERCGHLKAVQAELEVVQRRERISGRLVSNHVTGLMLPHDALPVRVTDTQADVILESGIRDKRMRRLLRPGPRRQGRR